MIKRTDAVRVARYAISAERRLRHPAVATITSAACTDLFVCSPYRFAAYLPAAFQTPSVPTRPPVLRPRYDRHHLLGQMNGLVLDSPRLMDIAVPANRGCGLRDAA